MGYPFQLAARVLLYASSHIQDNTYHGLCYTSCGALIGMRNSSMNDRSDDPSHHEQKLHLAPDYKIASQIYFNSYLQ